MSMTRGMEFFMVCAAFAFVGAVLIGAF